MNYGQTVIGNSLVKNFIIDHKRFINHKELYNCKKNVIKNIERITFFFYCLAAEIGLKFVIVSIWGNK